MQQQQLNILLEKFTPLRTNSYNWVLLKNSGRDLLQELSNGDYFLLTSEELDQFQVEEHQLMMELEPENTPEKFEDWVDNFWAEYGHLLHDIKLVRSIIKAKLKG